MGPEWGPSRWFAFVSVLLHTASSQVSLPYGCDFETSTLCGFMNNPGDDFNWDRNSGSTPTVGTGPRQAYGGSYYIYTEASDPRLTGDRAILETPIINVSGPVCVEFHYHMYGPDIGSLYINTASRPSGQYWGHFMGDYGDQWLLGQVDVDLQPNDKIQFIGERGNEIRGDIALDSIFIRQGQCLALPLSCSFEYSLCGLIQRSDDQFDWMRLRGATETGDTGPLAADDGVIYVYAESSYPLLPDYRATLETPRFAYQGWICVHFRYHMYGQDMGALEVILSDRDNIFRRYGNQGNAWHSADINVRIVSGDKIAFTAIRGSNYRSDIAMDSLDISLGNCTVDTSISQPNPATTGLPPVTNPAVSDSFCRLIQDVHDDFDWSFASGRTPSGANYDRRIHNIRYPVTGPGEAEQGLYYGFIEASGKISGMHAGLIFDGPMFAISGQGCLRFSYCMNGFHCGELYVFLDMGRGREKKWSMEGDKLNGWRSAAVDVDMTGILEFGLMATTKGSFSGDISVDDIQLIAGTCQTPGTGPAYFWFCNFETNDGSSTLCNMENDQRMDTSGFDWILWTGETPSRLTGPSIAYNGPNYIYIEASQPRQPGDTADIFLPHMNRTGDVCVEFWCHMFGFHIDRLEVFTRMNDLDTTVWTLAGEQGESWVQKRVTVSGIEPDLQIGFRGVRGSEYSGDIALDNIQVRPGVC